MADGAAGGIEPLLAAEVISHRQDLQAAPLQRREEVKDVLAPHRLFDPVPSLSIRPPGDNNSLAHVRPVAICADANISFLFTQIGPRQGIGLHGQAMMGRSP